MSDVWFKDEKAGIAKLLLRCKSAVPVINGLSFGSPDMKTPDLPKKLAMTTLTYLA